MFSILDDEKTTPEQVEEAVTKGLIHRITANIWLLEKGLVLKPGIEIHEVRPSIYGAKKSLLRGALLDAVRALVDDLDPRVGRPDPRQRHKAWPDVGREEELREEIGLLLEMLPRLNEGPF